MINLHKGQSQVFRDLFIDSTHRYSVVCCSRGWGKSYMGAVCAVKAIFELMALPCNVPNKKVFIIAPTHDQVIDIYYNLLLFDLGMEHYVVKAIKELGKFLFPKNVELKLISFESIERLRGKGAYFIVWDEVCSCKSRDLKHHWQSTIQPAITTRWSKERALLYNANPGKALIISTPSGYNYFYDMYNYADNDSSWRSYQFDYTQSPLLSIPEIDLVRANSDPRSFATEYLAIFEESGNNVFYCFNRKIHLLRNIEPISKNEVVHVCIDFNVGLQCTSVMVIRAGICYIIDELKGHPDTENLAIAIKARYKDHKICAYPDPSGRSRKTSATGRTDFSILESYGIHCFAHKAAPSIVDSVAAVNRKLMNASGQISLYVSSKCTGVAHSLERTKWVDSADSAVIDKSEGIEHYSDGIRYGIEYLFPIQGRTVTKRGEGF